MIDHSCHHWGPPSPNYQIGFYRYGLIFALAILRQFLNQTLEKLINNCLLIQFWWNHEKYAGEMRLMMSMMSLKIIPINLMPKSDLNVAFIIWSGFLKLDLGILNMEIKKNLYFFPISPYKLKITFVRINLASKVFNNLNGDE